jgi:DNA-binding PucR family transcriptional regulator
MSIAFELTHDDHELRELLDASARSLFSFIDATNAAIAAQIQTEREELTRGTHAERREVVELIIAGAPISPRRAAGRLGYNLEQTHTAAVICSDLAESHASRLDLASERLARTAGRSSSGEPLSRRRAPGTENRHRKSPCVFGRGDLVDDHG